MAMRLIPAAIILAVLAALIGLGAEGLSVYRIWQMDQGKFLADPYYFAEGLKHLTLMGGIVGAHLAAFAVCLLVLRNAPARTAAYFFAAGLVAIAVLDVASVWPVISGAWPPKRYIDFAKIDFATPRRVGEVVLPLAATLLLAGWVMLVIAVSRRRIAPAPGTV